MTSRSALLSLMLLLLGGSVAAATLSPSSTQLTNSVAMTFEVTGGRGQLSVVTPSETFICRTTCTRTLRGGAAVTLTATSDIGEFKAWQGCTGRITQNVCAMNVPTSTLAAKVSAEFRDLLTDMNNALCESQPDFCKSSRDRLTP